MPRIISLCRRITNSLRKFAKRIYQGMNRSDTNSFRKFYTLILLMTMLLYQYTDFHIASDVAREVRENIKFSSAEDSPEMLRMAPYLPLLTKPLSTITAGVIAILLFSYKLADKTLNMLHKSRQLFTTTGLVAIVITVIAPRSFILGETLLILLIGAYIYPPQNSGSRHYKIKGA